MRDYGKISPQFWTGQTGKALRGNTHAQLVALYLMTSPHSNMIGIYTLPIMYIAHETGLTLEGASKALLSLCEAKFCTFEADSELVWVHEMARFQIGDKLEAKDKRCKGVQNELEKVSSHSIRRAFYAKYKNDFHLSPFKAPSKPLASQEQEQEQEQEQDLEAKASLSPAKLPTCPTQDLIDLYHKTLPTLPTAKLLSDARRKALSSFWKWVLTEKRSDGKMRATTAEEAMAWVKAYFERAGTNDFLMGRMPQVGAHAGWVCDLDFLLTDRGKKQVIEKTREAA